MGVLGTALSRGCYCCYTAAVASCLDANNCVFIWAQAQVSCDKIGWFPSGPTDCFPVGSVLGFFCGSSGLGGSMITLCRGSGLF